MRGPALALFLLAACGGAAETAAPAQSPPASVLALQVDVAQVRDDTFCPALAGGLARAGIRVTGDDDGSQPDAIVTCVTTTRADDAFFRAEVNGQARRVFDVRVEVRAARSRTLVDSFVAEYKGYPGRPPDDDAVARAVLAFAYSPRVAAFARAVHARRAAPSVVAPSASAPAPPVSHADRDDADWFAIDTVKCKIPARVEACDLVRRYLQRHPDGAHTDEARALLAAAEPALEKLQKDEVAWHKANRSLCAGRLTTDACVGVEAYLLEFPTGLHAEDAHRLLRRAHVEK